MNGEQGEDTAIAQKLQICFFESLRSDGIHTESVYF